MTKEERTTALTNLKAGIDSLEKKTFNVYFFVMDTKGNPSGELTYIYQTARQLHDMGYNVTMLHQEKNFVGVGDWLGEKYAALPHMYIEKQNIALGVGDFLFIPEIYANVMSQVKKAPAKKVAILHNIDYLTSTIPIGVTWNDMNFNDAITSTDVNKRLLNTYFPVVKTRVVSPAVPDFFKPQDKPQKLMINLLCRETTDCDKIIKTFYWKYPVYQWVSFRDIRGIPYKELSEVLADGAITIWVDDKTDFGYTLLQALKSKTVVLAKTPNTFTDWMVQDNELIDGPIWFTNYNELPDMIASVVRTWTLDNMPKEVYESEEKFADWYTEDDQRQDIIREYVDGLFKDRKIELEKAYDMFLKKNNEETAE